MSPALIGLIGVLFGGAGAEVLKRAFSRRDQQGVDDGKIRDELWREVARMRGEIGALGEKVDTLQREVLAERETAGRLRIKLATMTARAETAEAERDALAADLEMLRTSNSN